MSLTLVLGGARSGKSRRALALAAPYPTRVFIATAEPGDAEMAQRIARHRAERDASWQTIEEPLHLADALAAQSAATGAGVVVVDCLTLWLSNLMHATADIDAGTTAFLAAAAGTPYDVVAISNEVGLGLVPETPLGRGFRDAQGRLNQRVAAAADAVEFVAAGLPLRLKPAALPLAGGQ